jgi:hypothetical protein
VSWTQFSCFDIALTRYALLSGEINLPDVSGQICEYLRGSFVEVKIYLTISFGMSDLSLTSSCQFGSQVYIEIHSRDRCVPRNSRFATSGCARERIGIDLAGVWSPEKHFLRRQLRRSDARDQRPSDLRRREPGKCQIAQSRKKIVVKKDARRKEAPVQHPMVLDIPEPVSITSVRTCMRIVPQHSGPWRHTSPLSGALKKPRLEPVKTGDRGFSIHSKIYRPSRGFKRELVGNSSLFVTVVF